MTDSDPFADVHAHDSSVTMPVPDAVKVSGTQLADDLKANLQQGHIESNVLNRMMSLVQTIFTLFMKG